MYRLAISELPIEGFSWKILSWTQRTFRILKIENVDVCVWLYWCYTVWQLNVYFLYTLFSKHSSPVSSIGDRPFVLRRWRFVCCVLDSLGGLGESVCAVCGGVWGGWGSECVGQIGGVGGVSVWDRLGGLGERVCSRWLCGRCVFVCRYRLCCSNRIQNSDTNWTLRIAIQLFNIKC
jgi:hypothetical protein